MIAAMIVIVLVLGVIFYVIAIYNHLVASRNRYKNAFSQIDIQLTRRNDLIPNLVETAKAYLKHERETLEAVIQARNQAVQAASQASKNPGDPASMRKLASAETSLAQTLGRLMVVAESYPELKANQNMMQFSEELTSTENKIAFARQAFNDAVTEYNISREQFPGSIIASSFGFSEASLLEGLKPEEKKAPKIAFG